MSKWLGIVKWNGDHYYSGDEVKGSQIKVENNELFLFHDEIEEIYIGGKYLGENARDVWVEIKEVRLIEDETR